ncbi:MAG: LuxR C-terminal-related transcriptional regulator [Minwuia sp.]|nr:LuxR C-terminal-related transcriptional regulator [Minwuia sp.]
MADTEQGPDLEFEKLVADAISLDDLGDALEYKVRAMGYAGYVYYTHRRKPLDEIVAGEPFVLSRGPGFLKAFEAIYYSRGMFRYDPMLQLVTERYLPFTTLGERSQMTLTRRQRWIWALEKRFGIKYDLFIPMNTPLRTQALYLFMLGDPPNAAEIIASTTSELHRLALRFTVSVADFLVLGQEDELAGMMFSRREQECLAWMSKGRSNGEIGEILGISERTVKFHVANLMKKLNAANRTEAIAIAARSGWLTN